MCSIFTMQPQQVWEVCATLVVLVVRNQCIQFNTCCHVDEQGDGFARAWLGLAVILGDFVPTLKKG